MTDEVEATSPETEVAQEAIEDQAPEQSEQPDAELDDQDGEQTQADDGEDVEYEGKKYRLPKDIAGAVMRHADYTQKTQSLAEERAQYEERAQNFRTQVEAHGALMEDLSKFHAVDFQVKELDGLDWEALNQEDPERTRSLFFRLERLKAERDEIARGLDQKNRTRLEAEDKTRETARTQAHAILNKPDPALGWDKGGLTPERAKRLNQVGQTLGLSMAELGSIIDPRIIKGLNLAAIGLATIEKQRAATAKPTPSVNPSAKVGTQTRSNTVRTNLGDDSIKDDAEWLRRRRAQLNAR